MDNYGNTIIDVTSTLSVLPWLNSPTVNFHKMKNIWRHIILNATVISGKESHEQVCQNQIRLIILFIISTYKISIIHNVEVSKNVKKKKTVKKFKKKEYLKNK